MSSVSDFQSGNSEGFTGLGKEQRDREEIDVIWGRNRRVNSGRE